MRPLERSRHLSEIAYESPKRNDAAPDFDAATLQWLSINDPNKRRFMWHRRLLNDRVLTLTAVRLAGWVMHDYENGQGKPVKLPLLKTAKILGIEKTSMIRARDLLVERGWLRRVNDGSTRTGAYELGTGPRVSATTPSRVSPALCATSSERLQPPMPDLSPEAQKVLDARKAAAAELQAIDAVERELTHADVIRLANARLYEASVTLRVLAGEPIAASEIKAASALVEDARGHVKKPIEVRIAFEGPDVELYPHCGKDINAKPLPKPPVEIEGEVVKELPPASEAQPASAPAPATPVVEPERKDTRQLNAAFHDGGFDRHAPVRQFGSQRRARES
jgi:hypothetical protein